MWLPSWSKGGSPLLLPTALPWPSNGPLLPLLASSPIHLPTLQPNSYSGQSSQCDALKALVLLLPAPWLSSVGEKPESLWNAAPLPPQPHPLLSSCSLCSCHMPGIFHLGIFALAAFSAQKGVLLDIGIQVFA